jgi:hypothetical protein
MTMRDCADGELRDLLPDFVHGTLAATEQVRVRAHVASCADCEAEVELLRAVGAAFPTPAVDVRRIVAALPAGAGGAVRPPAFTIRPWRLAAAATILAVAGISLAVARETFVAAGSRSVTVATPGTVPHVEEAPVAAAGETIASVARPVRSETGLSFDGGLSDLTDQQVKALLVEIDALDAKPNAEPDSPVGHIVPVREGEFHES